MTVETMVTKQADILEVISNLSNNEVYTPPKVVADVLDLLPPEVWTDPTLRWLDPGCKTGIFPREITKRLMVGLAAEIADEQSRLEHILRNMVFAIGITEITSMMSRRTLYCSKDASGERATVSMPTGDGNVWFSRTEHPYVKGRCPECGGAEAQLEKAGHDNYAYGFIHNAGRLNIQQEFGAMQFDVIVGNPPYQMDGDLEGANVLPIYNHFVDVAKSLSPKYIAFIIPSRWMVGGKRLDEFRKEMLNDERLSVLVDVYDAKQLFPGVEIKGGVCYFLWDKNHSGPCTVTTVRGEDYKAVTSRKLNEFDVLVRDAQALPILRKVLHQKELSFSDLVSARDPFGPELSSNFRAFRKDNKKKPGDIELHLNLDNQRAIRWIDPAKVTKNFALVNGWKLFAPKAYGAGEAWPHQILGRPIIAKPNSACTLTYLVVGPFQNESEALSAESYYQTKFFRFLVSLRKISQNCTQGTYLWVPQQTWDRTWTDQDLFVKYGITKKEQAYLESMIKEMSA